MSSDQGLGPDHPDAHVLVPRPLASSDLGLDLVPDLPGDVTLALEAGPSLRREEGKARTILFIEGGCWEVSKEKIPALQKLMEKNRERGAMG